jgi:hypothetical protein
MPLPAASAPAINETTRTDPVNVAMVFEIIVRLFGYSNK